MNIQDARRFLDQLEQINPDAEVRLVVPHKDIKDHLQDFDARPVLQDSAWNNDEIVFKDRKLDLQNRQTS